MDKPNIKKALELKNVNFSYNQSKLILNDISFHINENEYVCIIGHNGSGKSTVSKILVGLLKPQTGILKIFDEEINYLNVQFLRDNVGIIFQNPDSQFIGLTGRDDIAFGLENKRINPSRMDEIIEAASKTVDVTGFLDKDSVSLSGGQKQRVAIASILAINPKIIIFDEATSMLDPKGKKDLKQIMLDLKNKAKKTVISITHDMDEVLNADRVIVFKEGRILKQGKPKEIFSNRDFLEQSALDFPFVLKLAKTLQENNLKVNLTIDQSELIKDLRKIK